MATRKTVTKTAVRKKPTSKATTKTVKKTTKVEAAPYVSYENEDTGVKGSGYKIFIGVLVVVALGILAFFLRKGC